MGKAYDHRPGFRLRLGTTGRREAANLGFRALAPRYFARLARRRAEMLCASLEFGIVCTRFEELRFAYIQSAGSQGAHGATVQDGLSGAAGFAAAAWSLHARLHADPQEAEFGAA